MSPNKTSRQSSLFAVFRNCRFANGQELRYIDFINHKISVEVNVLTTPLAISLMCYFGAGLAFLFPYCVPLFPICVPLVPVRVPAFSIRVLSFPIRVLSFPIRVLSFPIRVLSFPIRVLSFPIRVLSFPIRVPFAFTRVIHFSFLFTRVPSVFPSVWCFRSDLLFPICVPLCPVRVPLVPVLVPAFPIRVLSFPIHVPFVFTRVVFTLVPSVFPSVW